MNKKNNPKTSIWSHNEEWTPGPEGHIEGRPLSTIRNYCYGNTRMLLPTTICIVYTYMHTLVSCRPGPDGDKLRSSLICLGPLKECLKTSPIPSGCHQNAQRQRRTICSRHHGQSAFLSVLKFNPHTPFFLAILMVAVSFPLRVTEDEQEVHLKLFG